MESQATESLLSSTLELTRNLPHSDMPILVEYLEAISSKRKAGLEPSKIRRCASIERSRQKLWQHYLQVPRAFRDTKYLVVVDAVALVTRYG